jgi:hypothetical protein
MAVDHANNYHMLYSSMHLIFLSETINWFQSSYSQVSTTDYATNGCIWLSVKTEEYLKYQSTCS